MDVVTAYLYDSLDNEIYMNEGLSMLEEYSSKSREICSIRLKSNYMT